MDVLSDVIAAMRTGCRTPRAPAELRPEVRASAAALGPGQDEAQASTGGPVPVMLCGAYLLDRSRTHPDERSRNGAATGWTGALHDPAVASALLNAVAARVGYTSEYAFAHAFKRAYGHPPGTYRKQGRRCQPG